MYKKILSAVMALLIVASAGDFVYGAQYVNAPLTVNAADFTRGKYESYTYVKYADHVVITNCDSSLDGIVVIPDEIEGLPVTKINSSAFERCLKLSAVTVPESVAEIGESAFAACQELTEITILNPDCVIYDSPFTISTSDVEDNSIIYYRGIIRGYENSTAQAYAKKYDYDFFPLEEKHTDGVYDIFRYKKYDDHVVIAEFDNLDEFPKTIEIPAEIEGLPVTEIGSGAFYHNEKLTKVTIPDSVKFIDIRAFSGCSNLSEINIPESITEIGDGVFEDTKWLEDRRAEDPLVIVNNIIADAKTCTGDVVIPEGVTTISEYAFAFCNDLTSVIIPDTVTKIHRDAFYECRDLTEIRLSENITSIENYTFGDCINLADIKIPDSVTTIGWYAFSGCSSLKKVTVPESVSLIGKGAFYNCRDLEEITILDPDCKIYNYAATIANENAIDWDGTYNGIIRGYANSTAQAYAEKYGYKFEALAERADEGTYKSLTYKKYADHIVISKCDREAEGAIEIPAEIEGLPVTEIGEDAFGLCTELTDITIPDSVKVIEKYAFYGCTSLEEITLRENVEKIGERAFFCCEKLNKITILNPDCKIYESPETILTGYDEIEEEDGSSWKRYYYNGVISGYRGSTAQVYAEKFIYTFKSLYQEGTYENLTYDKHSDHIVITGCDNSAVSVSVPSEIEGLPVTEIGYKAFYYCNKMTDIVLPDSITVIGESAFEHCEKLTEITLPDNVTEIGKRAFELCEKLEKINIPDGVTAIEDSTFRWCGSLKEIILPDGVRSIGGSAFSSCTSLTKITVPDSVQKIGSHAFMQCESLTEIHIPDGVDTIEALTFGYCSSLTEITIPDSVTLIGNIAFGHCNSLTEITVPKSVKAINEGAFAECGKLKVIIILNPDCEISLRPDTITNVEEEQDGAFADYYYGVIRGYEDSTAQAYAQRYKRKFESLGEAPAEEILYGDANVDGAVTIADATAILQYLGNRDKYDLTEQGRKNADCHKPGSGVTPLDALAIQRLDANLIEKLPE